MVWEGAKSGLVAWDERRQWMMISRKDVEVVCCLLVQSKLESALFHTVFVIPCVMFTLKRKIVRSKHTPRTVLGLTKLQSQLDKKKVHATPTPLSYIGLLPGVTRPPDPRKLLPV